jgi:hypothetical protein
MFSAWLEERRTKGEAGSDLALSIALDEVNAALASGSHHNTPVRELEHAVAVLLSHVWLGGNENPESTSVSSFMPPATTNIMKAMECLRSAYFECLAEPKATGWRDIESETSIEWDKHPDLDEWYSKDRGLWDVADYVISPHSKVDNAWQVQVRGHLLADHYVHWKFAMQDCQADADRRAGHRNPTRPVSLDDDNIDSIEVIQALRAENAELKARYDKLEAQRKAAWDAFEVERKEFAKLAGQNRKLEAAAIDAITIPEFGGDTVRIREAIRRSLRSALSPRENEDG